MVEKNCQLKGNIDHRLKKNSQFNYIYRKGERFSSNNFVLFVVKSKFKDYKIGYAVPKKVGKAWMRNRLKRRMRECIRLEKLPRGGFNYILQAKLGAGELDSAEINRQIKQVFEKGKRVEG